VACDWRATGAAARLDVAHSHSAVHHCIAPTQVANPCFAAGDKPSIAGRRTCRSSLNSTIGRYVVELRSPAGRTNSRSPQRWNLPKRLPMIRATRILARLLHCFGPGPTEASAYRISPAARVERPAGATASRASTARPSNRGAVAARGAFFLRARSTIASFVLVHLL